MCGFQEQLTVTHVSLWSMHHKGEMLRASIDNINMLGKKKKKKVNILC